jgi:hypothetical protein
MAVVCATPPSVASAPSTSVEQHPQAVAQAAGPGFIAEQAEASPVTSNAPTIAARATRRRRRE